ncbi:MAG: hypothetical protein KF817_15940 [Phycisphaeraceae bacterium]|nr:hypothetical protein [Phycisphaeraceae bacterium]
MSRKSATSLVAMTVLALPLAGCLVTSNRSTSEAGTAVSSSTLDQIEPGRTTEAWLIATLGEPSQRTKVDDRGDAILRYDYRRVTRERGSVFLIFSGRSQRENTERTFFEVADGIVTRWWRES